MSGPRSGVAKQLRDEKPRAIYLHCHGYALNLAAGVPSKVPSVPRMQWMLPLRCQSW